MIKTGSKDCSEQTLGGFTLIELLVVISIIALLSTIVLASLQGARTKAQNTKKNEIVLQYINALELYAADHNGDYPASTVEKYDCLGFSSTEGCYVVDGTNWYTGLDSLNIDLKDYYNGTPKADEFIVQITTINLSGIMYQKIGSDFQLWWYLKNKSNCILGADTIPETNGLYTQCIYPKP